MPAQVVGADSVVTNRPVETTVDGQASSDDDSGSAVETKASRSFSLSGADLAIEVDPGTLLVNPVRLLANRSFQMAGYAVGSLCLLIAILDRRRRQVDPAVRVAQATLRAQQNRLAAAGKLPAKAAAKEIADALQAAVAEFPQADRITIQGLMQECEAIAYRPSGDDDSRIESDLIDRARTAISDLGTERELT